MKKLEIELKKGRTFSQYPTSKRNTESYYRFDDTKEKINCKSVIALIKRNILSFEDIIISNEKINY